MSGQFLFPDSWRDPERFVEQLRACLDKLYYISPKPSDDPLLELAMDMDEAKDLDRTRGIIDAMTPEERRTPRLALMPSRKRRIAKGGPLARRRRRLVCE